MRKQLIGWTQQPGGPLTEALSSISQLQPKIPELLLFYGPVARMNPYQALLYSSFAEENIAIAELIPVNNFKEITRTAGFSKRTAVHFHWINFVLQGASSKENAAWRVGKFLKEIDDLRSAGVLVVFTIHNKVPHDVEYPDEELNLQQGLIDRADIIHIMSRSAIASMREYATIAEEKCLVAPHPLYSGVYSDFLSRTECRRMLGIQPGEFVISLFGAIKPYKGISELRRKWEGICSELDHPIRLVVAGAADDSEETREFVDWASAQANVIIETKKIPFEQVQIFVKCADAGIVPYDRTLNSGAAMLHLTYGIPIICKNEPSIVEGLPENLVFTFDELEEIPGAIRQVQSRVAEGNLDVSAKQLQETRDWKLISRNFAKDLKEFFRESGSVLAE